MTAAAPTTHPPSRRHDIDALRSLAFAGVMLYHVGMAYVAGWDWHVKSAHATEALQLPMRAVSLFRLDLVFVLSGVSLSLVVAARGGDARGLLKQRSWRLLLPLAFGMAVVVPYQAYAQGVSNGLVAPGFGAFLLRYFTGGPWPRGAFDGWEHSLTWNHLWFLPYLWLYTAVLLSLRPLAMRLGANGLRVRLRGLRGWALIIGPALLLMASSLTLWPRFPATHDLLHDPWLHAVYGSLFTVGYLLGRDTGLWDELRRLRHAALAWALACLAVYLALRGPATAGLLAPVVVRLVGDLYAWAVIAAALGFGAEHLNRPWRWLPWARESVYPWYVLHQTLIVALVFGLKPLGWPAGVEATAVLLATALGCWALNDGLIRRSRWLRPLFGLPPRKAPSPG